MDPSALAPTKSSSMLDDLRHKIETVEVPPELKDNTLDMVARLERLSSQGFFSEEYEKLESLHRLGCQSSLDQTGRTSH